MGGNNPPRVRSDASDTSIPIFGIRLKKTTLRVVIGKMTLNASLVSLKG